MILSYALLGHETHHVRIFGTSVGGKIKPDGGLETNIRWLEEHTRRLQIPGELFQSVSDYVEQRGHPDEITPREVGVLHTAINTAAQQSRLTTADALEVCMNYLDYRREEIKVPPNQMHRRHYHYVRMQPSPSQ